MYDDKRTRLQLRLDRTQWQPFCFITGGSMILKDPEPAIFRDAALVTTALIARMMHKAGAYRR